jgi:hypothetical protein
MGYVHWRRTDVDAETVFLNRGIVDVTLVPTIRKPFDVLAEGLIQKSGRGDWTPIELFATGAGELSGHLRAFVLAA